MTGLPSPWHLYGLVASPFVPDSHDGAAEPMPVTAIVGREREVSELRRRIHDAAGDTSTIHIVAGAPGVGRSTLVRRLNGALIADGYLAAEVRVTVHPGDTLERVLGGVLGALFDTVLLHRPELAEHQEVQMARRLVLASRLGAYDAPPGSEHDTLARLRTGRQRRSAEAAGADLLEDGPAAMGDLVRLARDGRGIVLHLHYEEHLGEPEIGAAADVMHALRAATMGCEELHWVVTGTSETMNGVFDPERHPGGVIDRTDIDPLDLDALRALLRKRYELRRLAPQRPTRPPIDDEAVEHLHRLFRGDLRGVLSALHDGVSPLIGLAGFADVGSGVPVRPVLWQELRPMLQARYAERLAELGGPHRRRQLTLWGTRDPAAPQTQRSLMTLWGVTQVAVSQAMVQLIRAGYVLALPRRVGEPTEYVLSGVSRLMFD